MYLESCVPLLLSILSTVIPHTSDSYQSKLAKYTCYHSERADVNPIVSLAIMWRESRLLHSSNRSATDDIGIMQLHCPLEENNWWLCNTCNVNKLRCNIRQGIKYLGHLKRKYSNGSTLIWVQYYNYNRRGYWRKISRTVRRFEQLCANTK